MTLVALALWSDVNSTDCSSQQVFSLLRCFCLFFFSSLFTLLTTGPSLCRVPRGKKKTKKRSGRKCGGREGGGRWREERTTRIDGDRRHGVPLLVRLATPLVLFVLPLPPPLPSSTHLSSVFFW